MKIQFLTISLTTGKWRCSFTLREYAKASFFLNSSMISGLIDFKLHFLRVLLSDIMEALESFVSSMMTSALGELDAVAEDDKGEFVAGGGRSTSIWSCCEDSSIAGDSTIIEGRFAIASWGSKIIDGSTLGKGSEIVGGSKSHTFLWFLCLSNPHTFLNIFLPPR